jgi:hypothetical protein
VCSNYATGSHIPSMIPQMVLNLIICDGFYDKRRVMF